MWFVGDIFRSGDSYDKMDAPFNEGVYEGILQLFQREQRLRL